MSNKFKAGDIIRLVKQGKYGVMWDGPLTVVEHAITGAARIFARNGDRELGAFSAREVELVPNELDVLREQVEQLTRRVNDKAGLLSDTIDTQVEQGRLLVEQRKRIDKQSEQLAHLESRTAGLTVKLNRIDGGGTVRPTRAPGDAP